jgi:golgi apyrase
LVGSDHLKQLFDHAYDIIPEENVSSTPIFLLATAGMRLLPDLERKRLLDQICTYTRSSTNFLLSDCDLHIQVIPGETEGLYGWIAANYLLGGFDSPSEHNHGKNHHTYGFLDMGGASAQIAFAPNATEAEKHAEDLKLLRFRKVNGNVDEYKVFVTTWLEFGVHEARRRYVESLNDKYASTELPDPCLPKGLTISSKGDILTPDKINGKEIHIVGTANFQECLSATFPLLNKNKPCEDPPCLLNGVHVPAIDFDVNHFVGVSEYWHTTHEIFEFGHKDRAYDWKTYQERVDSFCKQNWKDIQAGIQAGKWGEKVTESITAEVCFKASWLINMLHDGIGIPRVGLETLKGNKTNLLEGVKGFNDAFQAVNKIDDTEVSWTLGKMVLYAASEIPPKDFPKLPVGFGSNQPGIPTDFQYAGIYHPPRPNSTETEPNWVHDTPRRAPGFLLFMFIICLAVFLLCGKDRRSRLYGKIARKFHRGKSYSEQRQHLLEAGLDFELSSFEDDDSDEGSLRKGMTSGLITPRLRTPKLDSNDFDRSGLFIRTESRESLSLGEQRRSRSRRGSPTRFKSPLGSFVVE